MAEWVNWSGSARADDVELRFPHRVDDLQAIVADAAAAGRRVRVAGRGHSHFPLVPVDDVIVDLSALSGVVTVADDRSSARCWAGTRIAAIGPALHRHGVALANQGDIDRQAIAGAVATGTHGTGRTLTSLADAVVGLTMIGADGELVSCSADERPELFRAARLGLGAFGVITELELRVVPAYRLAETAWRSDLAAISAETFERADRHRHFEFFWYPHRDLAFAKAIDPTDAPARYPLADEGERVAWNYEVLPNHRPRLHTELEYAVPLDGALDCLAELATMLQRDFPDARWPVEFRTMAADDVWLSVADEREVATISVHEGIEPMFRASEAVFRRYEGRPHWGKCHFLDGDELASIHPNWAPWWDQRDQVDPDGVFLNDTLAAWRGCGR
jgi:FAD/FMN-containing dehydrogenase